MIYNLPNIIQTKDWITEAVCFHFAHRSQKYDIARYMQCSVYKNPSEKVYILWQNIQGYYLEQMAKHYCIYIDKVKYATYWLKAHPSDKSQTNSKPKYKMESISPILKYRHPGTRQTKRESGKKSIQTTELMLLVSALSYKWGAIVKIALWQLNAESFACHGLTLKSE